jgi:uncharacterized protein YbcV (DUF1398 family)
MDTATIDECDRMSFADVPFPQVAARHAEAGVQAYRVDLIRCLKVCYDGADQCYEAALPLADPPPVGAQFDEAGVVGAVRAIQRGDSGYAEFLRRIMSAGCASYSVFLSGRKVVYFGRDGDFYVEHFPPAKP